MWSVGQADVNECSVASHSEVDAGPRAERRALRLYVGPVHDAFLSAAVLRTDPRLRRRPCKTKPSAKLTTL